MLKTPCKRNFAGRRYGVITEFPYFCGGYLVARAKHGALLYHIIAPKSPSILLDTDTAKSRERYMYFSKKGGQKWTVSTRPR